MTQLELSLTLMNIPFLHTCSTHGKTCTKQPQCWEEKKALSTISGNILV
jgi:hypothetical protein